MKTKKPDVLGHSAGIVGTEGAGKILGLKPDSVKRLAQRGQLSGIKIGKTWLFQVSAVKAFVRQPRGRRKK